MPTATSRQFNYTTFPLTAFATEGGKRALTLSAVAMVGMVYSYSKSRDDIEQICHAKYSRFEQKFNISPATVCRSLKLIRDKFIINKSQSSYTFNQEMSTPLFLHINDEFFTTPFKIRGEAEARILTKAEIFVLSFIYTRCSNKKRSGDYECSNSRIAHELGLSIKTVKQAVSVLLRADLIYRQKGINAYELSIFNINNKMFRTLARTQNKAQNKTVQAIKTDEDKTIARENYYAERRQHAQYIAEQNERKALNYLPYATANKEFNSLSPAIAMAEVRGQDVSELVQRQEAAHKRRLIALEQLGLTEADLKPQWHCKACEDTGFNKLSGKLCNCYNK
jgi:DNA-binding MarR family transcriptional regulator